MKHRIKVYTKQTGTIFRDLHEVHRNEHGDIVLTLDGGEAIQFTTHHAGGNGIRFTATDSPPPAIESIEHFAEDKKCCDVLKITGGFIFGFSRWLAPTAAAAKPEAKKRRKVNRNGGRKPDDGEKTLQAARDALAAMRNNSSLSLSRACAFQAKEHGLTISGRGLEAHARKIRRAK